MNKMMKLATVSALALMVAVPAIAQQKITGVEALNDQINDITNDAQEDVARGEDAGRYGPKGDLKRFTQ